MGAVCVCVCVVSVSMSLEQPVYERTVWHLHSPPPPSPPLCHHLDLSQATQRVEATIKRSAQNVGKGGGGSPVSSRPSSRAAAGAAAGKWGDSTRNAGDEFAAFNAFAVGTTGGGDAPAAKEAAPRVSYIDRYALWGEDQHQVAADVLLGQVSDLISSFDDCS
jgi:hypothetical protein